MSCGNCITWEKQGAIACGDCGNELNKTKGEVNMPYLNNLTPHSINEVSAGVVIDPKGKAARINTEDKFVGMLGGFPLFCSTAGEAVDLPDEKEGVFLLVSGQLRSALPGRKDLVSPGKLVRDEDGRPCGCFGFNTNNPKSDESSMFKITWTEEPGSLYGLEFKGASAANVTLKELQADPDISNIKIALLDN